MNVYWHNGPFFWGRGTTWKNVTNSIPGLNGLTRIVVTHSLDGTLLKRYDRILTLKNGSIIESGTFDELMEKKEYFYSRFTVSYQSPIKMCNAHFNCDTVIGTRRFFAMLTLSSRKCNAGTALKTD